VILPPYMRRSPKVTEVLQLLYLHGLSSGDFIPALERFFGSEASLSAVTITRSPSGGNPRAGELDEPRSLKARLRVCGWTASTLG
jgi:hypothetical protein